MLNKRDFHSPQKPLKRSYFKTLIKKILDKYIVNLDTVSNSNIFEKEIKTFIGTVSFGKNQHQKIIQKDRQKYLSFIEPTLKEPIFIIKDKNNGYLFVKSFFVDKKIYFNSVVVNIEDKNIVISNHQVKLNKIVNRIYDKGQIIFPADSFSAVSALEGKPQHEATLLPGNDNMISQNILKLQELLYKDLEISILRLSEVLEDNAEFRLNSEFFRKSYLSNRDHLLKLNNKYLKDGLYTFNARYKQPIYDEKTNLKVINSQYIRDYFIDYESARNGYGKIVPKEAVLVNSTGVGTLGRVNINYLEDEFTLDNHINVIVTDNINPYYLTIFLKSRFGQLQINRYYSGSSGQIEIYPKNFDNFVIPIFSNSFQSQIENLVKTAYDKLKESKTLYKEAQNLLLDELDLKDFQSSDKNIAIKSFKESFEVTGRLDSEYYQPKYDEILEKIKSYKGGWDLVKSQFKHIKTTFKKENKSYNYLEIGNINISDGSYEFNTLAVDNLPANAKIKVKKAI